MKAEQKRAQLRRVLQSPAIQNAQHLHDFLEFVGDRAIEGTGGSVTEYHIATQVFNRPESFDAANDTIVRTQAYRLRQKLKDYYGGEGANDPILLELPKGKYILTFTLRADDQVAPAVLPDAPRGNPWAMAGVLAIAAALLLAAGYWLGARNAGTSRLESEVLQSFWKRFIGDGGDALIGYTNQVLLVDEGGNKFLVPPGPVDERGVEAVAELSNRLPQRQGRVYFDDGFTGTGEVMAAQLLTLLLSRIQVPFSFRRSRLLNVEDLKQHNVIFVGSPGVNPALADLKLLRHFAFRAGQYGTPPWSSRIVNVTPGVGEAESFGVERRGGSGRLTHDYAVVSVSPGLRPGRKIMVLAGLTTSGTQGAVEFVTSAQHVEALWSKIGENRWPESMALLLRVEMAKGLDVQSVELLYTRVDGAAGASPQVK